MIYAVSDIHGEFERYTELLRVIEFGESDTLFVLGDVVDRGPSPVSVLLDMMKRPNVRPLMGNHELMMCRAMEPMLQEITEESCDRVLTAENMEMLCFWRCEGGDTTLDEMIELSPEKRAEVMRYVCGFSPYKKLRTAAGNFILVHAGLGNFSPERELDSYYPEELTTVRPDYDCRYFEDRSLFIVCGHTPTPLVRPDREPEIYRKSGNILIDCGATFGGRLACLCLDDMSEYYV